MRTIISYKKSTKTLWIKNSIGIWEDNSVKNSLGDNDKCVPVSYIFNSSCLRICLWQWFNEGFFPILPSWKEYFLHLEKREEGCCFIWLFINRPDIVKIYWVFRTVLYLSSKNLYFIYFSFNYCNHWTVKMRRTEIKIIFFLWLKDGRILYSLCCLSKSFLGEIQLPVVLPVISKIVETRAGLVPNRNDYGIELTFGFAEIPCLNLRCQSRFKVLSY